jgi:hypothetical protein
MHSPLKAMKTARAVFIGTADEPTTVQKYGHENGASRFHKKKVRFWIRE